MPLQHQALRISHLLIALAIACTGCARAPSIDADRANTYELQTAAAAAHRAGDLELAAFYFLAGQARYEIDKQVFPSKGQGSESPGILKAALSATIGQAIQSDMANDPASFDKAVARFAKWSPQLDKGYDPGWEYENPLGEKEAAAIVAAAVRPAVAAAQAKAKLLDNEEYLRLTQIAKEAGEVERKYFQEQQKAQQVPQELQEEYRKAKERRLTALRRIKDIEFELNPETRWHALAGWKAEDYFDDPDVVALCRAIAMDDREEMKRLITEGADVKAIGKQGMTPLLWAFPDRKIERFRLLLEHGADANVIIESDFGLKGRAFHPYPIGGSAFQDRGCTAGQSVTHLAARSPVIDYLKLALEYGADPNLLDRGTAMTPLDVVLDRHIPDRKERVELLVAKNADLNHYCEYKGGTPAMLAVQNDLYVVALYLLQSGADPKLYRPDSTEKLIHFVARKDRLLPFSRKDLADQYQALVDWLEQNGESLEQARTDEKEWKKRYDGASGGIAKFSRVREQIMREQRKRGRPEAVRLMKLPERDF